MAVSQFRVVNECAACNEYCRDTSNRAKHDSHGNSCAPNQRSNNNKHARIQQEESWLLALRETESILPGIVRDLKSGRGMLHLGEVQRE